MFVWRNWVSKWTKLLVRLNRKRMESVSLNDKDIVITYQRQLIGLACKLLPKTRHFLIRNSHNWKIKKVYFHFLILNVLFLLFVILKNIPSGHLVIIVDFFKSWSGVCFVFSSALHLSVSWKWEGSCNSFCILHSVVKRLPIRRIFLYIFLVPKFVL
jgi:hypothetical protein